MGSQGGNGQQFRFQKLGRHGSLYGLTLNEVQNQLAEPLHSMNLDELLRNIFSASNYRPFTIDLESSSSQVPLEPEFQRQGSLNLTRELSKKTVDEVWRDIQQAISNSGNGQMVANVTQPSLGEMTLEDFLVKAGIVPEVSDENHSVVTNSSAGAVADTVVESQGYPSGIHWLHQYREMVPLQHDQQCTQQNTTGTYAPNRTASQSLGIGMTDILDPSYTDVQITMSSPVAGVFLSTQSPGRKRVAPGGGAEKTVERKQKRMIKNRESAARSRARKQAYTHELENKISRLEEENARLKKQKVLDRLLYNAPPPEPKNRLRRTASAPF